MQAGASVILSALNIFAPTPAQMALARMVAAFLDDIHSIARAKYEE